MLTQPKNENEIPKVNQMHFAHIQKCLESISHFT